MTKVPSQEKKKLDQIKIIPQSRAPLLISTGTDIDDNFGVNNISGNIDSTIMFKLPPIEFIQKSSGLKLPSNLNYCFVLYSMDKAILSNDCKDIPLQSFQFFKDCYLKKNNSEFDLQRYFQILEDPSHSWDSDVKNNRHLSSINESGLEGITILSTTAGTSHSVVAATEATMSTVIDEEPYLHLTIFPKVILFNKTTQSLHTYKLINAHLKCFTTVLDKFKVGQIVDLYVNLYKIIESYVDIIFRDLTIKWLQWIRLIREDNVCCRASIRILHSKLKKRFWDNHFIFKQSNSFSIDNFTMSLKNLSDTHINDKKFLNLIGYGIWLDSTNGILIFGNSIISQDQNINNEPSSIYSMPTFGICIDDYPVPEIINKILLFVNFAILECFKKEISSSSSYC
ncbi:hypothetical protein Kpol_1054p8 [Vanderwaltozyma polyspora DSM 70294]|uniref:Uncharacterized protein n=1 Tax=Vanderwaltozyma polyspora (strain ATCC 22028 / DSM 70294 / BCRC 21397 / CBS 2163 / NBRC 10782 / NRRL Y-8283 / UCD 57-17) TaxID=436907 RepID=A7TI97_VANPO|nr:uncharacterized protein Kpol_1054p8 [Vanderwaltozyma polyspora DSM 70294]EDO17963.1 hypothetical protein Kpol_1054p8 [Vanderwaltozyma polyspora DSM 70294]